jgi:hypothetical protein
MGEIEKKPRGHPIRNLEGQTFGRWYVIRLTGIKVGFTNAWWLCRCQCGHIREIRGYLLTGGFSKSCSCHQHKWNSGRAHVEAPVD